MIAVEHDPILPRHSRKDSIVPRSNIGEEIQARAVNVTVSNTYRVVSTQNSETRWGACGKNVFDRMLQAQYPRLYVTGYLKNEKCKWNETTNWGMSVTEYLTCWNFQPTKRNHDIKLVGRHKSEKLTADR